MKSDKTTLLFGGILFISLFVNLFMGGLMIGGSVGSGVSATSSMERQDQKLRETLSDADKLVLEQAMDSHRAKVIQIHDEVEKIKGDVRDLVRQQGPLNDKALVDLFESRKKKELAMARLARQTREEAMGKMSPEGQVTLSKINRLFNLDHQCR